MVEIMLKGSHADAIRAIQVLNQMEREEQERGGGERGEFDELVALICRRRRLLPHEDLNDGAVDIEDDVLPIP